MTFHLLRTAVFSLALILLIDLDLTAATQGPPPAATQGPNPAAAPAKPAIGTPPTIGIPRVSRPPKLEDFLNNTSREAETKVNDFRQREPHDGDPVSQATTGYLSYDDKNLYVAIECKDQPNLVRAHMSRREDIFNDDVVGVMLDTFHDRRRAYEFFVNPLGVQLDGTTVEGQNDDFSFDTLWHSEGRLTADGFTVLLAIPFKSLRFSNADPQTWGIAIFRLFARNNEQSFWPYITRRVQGF
ncbi:MAG TPA: carbohydrate binding family 9 domain-containing protein, partial [Blastocatellia bacterium]|nr:carbohydrate binding family 9 domain-containing protein [Blastocatellia bacterium]